MNARAVIEAERLIAIVRLDDEDEAVAAVSALAEGGVRAIELSLASSASLAALERAGANDPGLLLGAGTVLTLDDARRAAAAGAAFLVAPTYDPDILAWAHDHDLLYIPGALTPGEVAAAHRGGAELVKLFPAARLGPEYVRDLLGPFPDARLVPTGGIDETNARAFLDAGAIAVGVGGSLVRAPDRVRAAARYRQLTMAA